MTDAVNQESGTPGLCGSCSSWNPKPTGTMGDCSNGKLVYDSEPEPDGLAYGDYDDFRAYLYTGPEFGCVHWYPRHGAAKE